MKKYILMVKKYVIFQVILDLIGVMCLALSPLIQKWLFDYGLNSTYQKIVCAILLYFTLLIVYASSQYLCVILAFKGGIKFETILKRDFFSNVFKMEKYIFYKNKISDYISIQGNDIVALEQDYLEPLIDIIRSVNMMIIYGVILFFAIDYRLALIIVVFSIVSIFIPKILDNKLKLFRQYYQKEQSEYLNVITDLLDGFELINGKTINSIKNKHEKALKLVAEKRLNYGKNKALVLFVSELFTKLVKIVTFGAVAILFYKKEITFGVGIATLNYTEAFINPIDRILYDVTTMSSMGKIKEKILSYVNLNYKNKQKISDFESIEFKNVCFSKKNFRINNINLKFDKNKKYAIIGKNGSGKTSLVKLLIGAEKPSSGNIYYDNKNLMDLDVSDLIAYDSQKSHIYRTDLLENITVFDSYEISEIIKENLIFKKLLNKKDNESCQKFSGGEKQLIAFLRALSKNSKLLVLDEPFSAVDSVTKKYLEQFIFSEYFKNTTVIMITHDTNQEFLKLFDEVINL